MDSTDSSSGPQHPQLPPGYRFHPTDEELVVHYLKKKLASAPLPVAIIAEVDLYKFDPWELPAKATFGDQEWYFFSPRDRKYPNGARPNRAATSGYWKATGTDKPILTRGGTQKIAVKKALVFYRGKPPKGIKTNWIMHEYRLIDNNAIMQPPGIKKNSSRLDDWVLCRIYKKNNSQRPIEVPMEIQATKASGLFLENNDTFFEGLLSDSQLASKPDQHNPSSTANYWNEETGSDAKIVLQANQHNNTTTVANLMNQIPQQTSPFHHQLLLGSLGDGVYRQQYQGMNWNS